MVMHRMTASCVAAVALVACDPGSTPIAAPPALAVAANGEHRVIGSGHVQQTAGMREFVFHALQDAAGNATGSYTVTLANGLFFTANVTCLVVEGNTGWVGGRIVDTNASAIEVGSISYFWARDNGEGAGASPDIVSVARINDEEGQDQVFCNLRLLDTLAPLSVTDGNVQVR